MRDHVRFRRARSGKGWRRGAAIVALAAACTATGVPTAPAVSAATPLQPLPLSGIHVRDGRFVDAAGRELQLHGANVVFKRAPYVPSEAQFGPADADLMRAMGFDVVRLGFIWKGMEPTRGVIDQAYLDRYVAIVRLLASRGIVVLVDSHQDVWNERYGGEGAPDWATKDDYWFHLQFPSFWPLPYFIGGDLWQSEDRFWADGEGIQTEFLRMWTQVADRLRHEPNVLGYDILNEPHPGSRWTQYGIDRQTSEAMYRRAIAAIRQVDPAHTVFWEPAVTIQYGQPVTTEGLGTVDTNLAFSHHVYCGLTMLGLRFPSLCEVLSEQTFAHADEIAARNSSALLASEFGATPWADDVDVHARLAERHLQSWTNWSWKQYDDPTGNPSEGIVTTDVGAAASAARDTAVALARVHARAVAGHIRQMSFDVATGRFQLAFTPDPSVTAATEIVIPQFPTPATTAPSATWTVTGGTAQRVGDTLLVTTTPGSTSVAVDLTVAR